MKKYVPVFIPEFVSEFELNSDLYSGIATYRTAAPSSGQRTHNNPTRKEYGLISGLHLKIGDILSTIYFVGYYFGLFRRILFYFHQGCHFPFQASFRRQNTTSKPNSTTKNLCQFQNKGTQFVKIVWLFSNELSFHIGTFFALSYWHNREVFQFGIFYLVLVFVFFCRLNGALNTFFFIYI